MRAILCCILLATRRVGCGSAARGLREIWVCNYDPPGNYVGQRPY